MGANSVFEGARREKNKRWMVRCRRRRSKRGWLWLGEDLSMLTASVKEAVARRDESEEETQSTGQARTGQALHATATSASPWGP